MSAVVGVGRQDAVEVLTDRLRDLSTSSQPQDVELMLDEIVKVKDAKERLKLFIAFAGHSYGKVDPFKLISTFRSDYKKNPQINPFIFKVANGFFETQNFSEAKRAILEIKYGCEPLRDEFLVKLAEAFYAEKRYQDALKCISAIKDCECSKRQFVRFSQLDLGDFDPIEILYAFHEIHSTSVLLNSFIFEVANSYVRAKNIKAARNAVMQLSSGNNEARIQRDRFLATLCTICLKELNYEEAMLSVSQISDNALFDEQIVAMTQDSCNVDSLKLIECHQNRDPKSTLLNKFIVAKANTYLQVANIPSARAIMSKLVAGSTDELEARDTFLLELSEICFAARNYDEAWECTSAVRDVEARFGQFLAFSERDLGSCNPITAIDAFLRFNRTSTLFNPFICKTAKAYLKEGELQLAEKTIVKLVCATDQDIEERDRFLHTLAARWYDKEEYEKAFTSISIVRPWSPLRYEYIRILFKKHLDSKDWPNAVKVVRSIDDSDRGQSATRESCLAELATACTRERQWKVAEDAIHEIIHDEKSKVSLTYALVESCLESGERQIAFTIITRFRQPETPDYQILNSLTFFRVVRAYFKENDPDPRTSVAKYIRAAIQKEFWINGVMRAYPNTVIKKLNVFSDNLVAQNYDLLRQLFESDNWEESMDRIEQLIRMQATFEAFKKYCGLKDNSEPSFDESQSRKRTGNSDEIQSLYKMLGLDSTASTAQVKKQYRKLVLLYHPDKIKQENGENAEAFATRYKEAVVKFDAITIAYQYLTK